MTLPAVGDKYTVRPATMDDAQAVTDLMNDIERLIDGRQRNVEGLQMRWGEPDINLATSTALVHDADGRLVAFVGVLDTGETPVHPAVTVSLHPDLDDATYRSLGKSLMGWAVDRAKRVFDRVPEKARVSLVTGTDQKHERLCALLREFGMIHIRNWYEMRIVFDGAPEEPVWPEGITVRSYQNPDDLEGTADTLNASFQDQFGFVSTSNEQTSQMISYQIENDPELDTGLWYLAFDGETMAGLCLCDSTTAEDPDMGWVDSLGVRREYRKRGLGMALLRHALCELHRRGRKSVGLGVDASSITGATRLYEKAGMHVHRVQEGYELELRPGEELARME